MKTAIIIPTKNEEKYLPMLATSIRKQTYKNFLVIIADAFSTDNTRKIAESYGFVVVDGGMPFAGRNNGASEAIKRGCDPLIFMDADIVLPHPFFLERTLQEFKARSLELAGTLQTPYDTKQMMSLRQSRKVMHKAIYWTSNTGMRLMEHSRKPMMQVCMFATKHAHKIIGGFKPLEFGEDSQYSSEGRIKGLKFGILRSGGKVFISPRRYEEKGFIKAGNLFFLTGMMFGHQYFYGKSKRKYFD